LKDKEQPNQQNDSADAVFHLYLIILISHLPLLNIEPQP
jgi:hypothetical protein